MGSRSPPQCWWYTQPAPSNSKKNRTLLLFWNCSGLTFKRSKNCFTDETDQSQFLVCLPMDQRGSLSHAPFGWWQLFQTLNNVPTLHFTSIGCKFLAWREGEHQLLEPERAKQRPASAQPGTSAGKRQVDLYFNSRSPCFWISKNDNRLTTCTTPLKL